MAIRRFLWLVLAAASSVAAQPVAAQPVAVRQATQPPALAPGKAAGMAYDFQPAPAAAGPATPAPLLVYFHGMQRGEATGIERRAGLIAALSRWAAARGMALLIPHAPRGRCAGTGLKGRDWHCWNPLDPAREAQRLARLVAALDRHHGPFGPRTAVGFSRGAYLVTALWAAGRLDGWAHAGALAGAQPPTGFAFSPRTPPLALVVGRGDPGNRAYVATFLAALDRRAAAPPRCATLTDAAHLPTADELTAFLAATAGCQRR